MRFCHFDEAKLNGRIICPSYCSDYGDVNFSTGALNTIHNTHHLRQVPWPWLLCSLSYPLSEPLGLPVSAQFLYCTFCTPQVCFKPGIGNPQGCRALTRLSLDRMCLRAKCTILHQISNDYLDAYVLSESSLFVYPHKVSLYIG